MFDVLTELDAKGLTYEVVGSGNSVVNQAPHGPVEVEEGSHVILYVEKGEGETGNIVVPDVKGMTKEEAMTALVDAGLMAEFLGEEGGVVSATSPQYGVTVEEGSTVQVTLSLPEEETEETEETAEATQTAQSTAASP